jgi:CRISPR-associated protein Cas1
VKKLLNVLYVLSDDAYISKIGETICVKVGDQEKVRVPIHTIESIVCFAKTTVSSPFLEFCGERGVGLSFLDNYGHFYGRLEGPVHGNVLLRRKQYLVEYDYEEKTKLAVGFVLTKIANSRNTLLRAARDTTDHMTSKKLSSAAKELAKIAESLKTSNDLDTLRGHEGRAGAIYFSVFNYMIKQNKEDFYFKERSRRPPRDRVNALLSFLYALLLNDTKAALETVGLDPACGYLHALRPGRPSLALDIMEELRSPLCDRVALSLINLKKLTKDDFEENVDAVLLSTSGRKKVIVEWQKRKQEEITHPFLDEKISIGLIPYVQAQLLARHLRGDLEAYPPFLWK